MKEIEKRITNYNKYDVIVVGSGFSGATIAERFANDSNKKVLVIDKRTTIAGNMYDYNDGNGILVHQYGPHIFHTNLDNVFNYLSMFTEWFKYEHNVLAKVNNKLVPVPFNFNSIDLLFDKELSDIYKNKLLDSYNKKDISILELRKSKDKDIIFIANFIYKNIFLYYTVKQWNYKPNEIDSSIINRVPVRLSYDNRYFSDKYQYMPKYGYTKLIERMLDSPNIDIKLNTNINSIIKIKDNKIYINNKEYLGKIIYTGSVDELLNYKYGTLPYRSINFIFEEINKEHYQIAGVINYPTKEDKFTRITEYKYITMESINSKKTTISKEYPCEYKKNENIPYYPIINTESEKIYKKYLEDLEEIDNLYLLGRLANYKYYNMDIVIDNALKLYEDLKGV